MSDLVELLRGLVEIDSINPDLIPGAAGEAEIARYVAEWSERAGLEAVIEEAAPGRPNVIATARGSGGGRTLLLNAHMDTVGVDTMETPFDARVEDGRLYGRGSYDMKGSLAAILVVAVEAKKRGLRGDVVVAAVADEEVASIGTESLVAIRPPVRRGGRGRADRARRRDRAQRLRRLRDRDPRPRRARFPSRPRRGRDRAHGPCPRPPRRALGPSTRQPDAPAPRQRLDPRLADRGRAGVLELSRALPAHRRAAHPARRVARGRRARAATSSPATGSTGSACRGSRSRWRRTRRSSGSCTAMPGQSSSVSRSGRTQRSSPPPASRRSSSARTARARTQRSNGSTWPRSNAASRCCSRSPYDFCG